MKYREILADITPFLSGIFLMIGYFAAVVMEQTTAYREVSVEVQEPVYKRQKIGEAPKDHFAKGKPEGFRDIYADVPELDGQGKPVLKKSRKIFHGRGTPRVLLDNTYEITIPKMGSPPWKTEMKSAKEVLGEQGPYRGMPQYLVLYRENIENVGTGVFFISKRVDFDVGVDPKAFAIYGSILGTLISLGLLIKKYYRKFEGTDRK